MPAEPSWEAPQGVLVRAQELLRPSAFLHLVADLRQQGLDTMHHIAAHLSPAPEEFARVGLLRNAVAAGEHAAVLQELPAGLQDDHVTASKTKGGQRHLHVRRLVCFTHDGRAVCRRELFKT